MHEVVTRSSRPGKAGDNEKMKVHNPYTPLATSDEDACAPDLRTPSPSDVRTGMGTMPALFGLTRLRKTG